MLKYAKSIEANRQLATSTRMYEKECHFYTKLHAMMGDVLPIADCLGVYVDPEKPDEFFCIAMEDLSVDFEPCDQIVGITWQECSKLAEKTAQMHAAFWEHDCLKQDLIGGKGERSCNIWYEPWCHGTAADIRSFDIVYEKLKEVTGIDLVSTAEDKLAIALWKKHAEALMTVCGCNNEPMMLHACRPPLY